MKVKGTSTLIPKLAGIIPMLILLRNKEMNQPLEPTEDYVSRLIVQGDEQFGNFDDAELIDTYGEMVEEKAKPGNDIVATLTPEKAELWHMGTGVCTEAGELLDAIKKHCIYNKPVNTENLIEEIGDLMFYTVGMIQWMQRNIDGRICLERILEANIMKLRKRYKAGYSDSEAQQRADKTEGAAE